MAFEGLTGTAAWTYTHICGPACAVVGKIRATTCCCARGMATISLPWATCCLRLLGWMSWTATCFRRWGTESSPSTRSAWGCRCTAATSVGHLSTRYAISHAAHVEQSSCLKLYASEHAPSAMPCLWEVLAAHFSLAMSGFHGRLCIAQGRHCRAFRLRAIAVQGLTYEETEGDEVEDMLQLIAHVQRRHPALQAVSSGAIASDYQRLRVEHVSFPRRQAPRCSCHPAQACNPFLVVFTLKQAALCKSELQSIS